MPPDAASAASHVLPERFQRLKQAVFSRRPILKEIVQKRGSKTLYAYAKDYTSVNMNPPIQRRQGELIAAVRKEIEERLGPAAGKSAAEQLGHHYVVSTADHHGPICHPFFLNSNLINAAPHFEQPSPKHGNIIVLACANVSLNNSSFPRGLLFHGIRKDSVATERLTVLPASVRLCPVYSFRSYTRGELDRVHSQVRDFVRTGVLTGRAGDALATLLEEVYATPEVLGARSFSDQVTMTNAALWKRYFAHTTGMAPNLIYLEQESITRRLLVDHHLDSDTVINHALFDEEFAPFVEQHFEGIMGAFSRSERWGTYFFWALPKGAKYRIQLWRQGNALVSDDHSVEIPLTPDAIRNGLEDRTLIPGMMTIFLVLAFYYGLKCLGGFSQVNYLTFMKAAYIKMLADRGRYKSIEVCARVQTKELGGDYTVAFIRLPDGQLVPATGLDLILYGNKETWPAIINASKQILLEEALNPMMPEFYRIIYTEAQRDPALASITENEITALTHLDRKIIACASIG